MRGEFQVELPTRVRKEMRAFPDALLERLLDAMNALSIDPFAAGTKKLQGAAEYRIRVGDYRILYEVNTEARVVTIVAVAHRNSAYR